MQVQPPLLLLCPCWALPGGSAGGQQHQSCVQSLAPWQGQFPAARCQRRQCGRDQQCRVENFLLLDPCAYQPELTCLLAVV